MTLVIPAEFLAIAPFVRMPAIDSGGCDGGNMVEVVFGGCFGGYGGGGRGIGEDSDCLVGGNRTVPWGNPPPSACCFLTFPVTTED